MDHVVYLDSKSQELTLLASGKKSMILRGAMGRKLPYGKVFPSDVLFFIENKGDGLVKAKAIVDQVLNSEKLTREESETLVDRHQSQLQLGDNLKSRFRGKRFLVLISLSEFKMIEPFRIDRSAYSNMDDWLPVGEIDKVRYSHQ